MSSSLRTKASAPASNARSSAPCSSDAVSSRQGSPRSAASSRSRRITVAPSIPGMTPSTMSAAGRREAASRNPFSPDVAVMTP